MGRAPVTRDDVLAIFARLYAVYGRHHPDDGTVDQWHSALERYSLELAQQGLDRIVDDGKPGPNLVQMLEYIRAVQRGEEPSLDGRVEWEGASDRGRAHIVSIRRTLAGARDIGTLAKLRSGKLRREDARDH
jgi:hypothetical protein